jgi:hypothetical protein
VLGSRLANAKSRPPNPHPISTISTLLLANIVEGYILAQSISDGFEGLHVLAMLSYVQGWRLTILMNGLKMDSHEPSACRNASLVVPSMTDLH